MALMHPHTTMSPTKLELISSWLVRQPWFTGDVTQIERVGEYRFDDPDGEVGLNGVLVRAGGETVYHVPLTYRDAPLEAGDDCLVGTSEHGVLGTRWVTAALGDPVFRAVLAQVIAQGGEGAAEFVTDEAGTVSEREITVPVRGSGDAEAAVPEVWAAEISTVGGASVASTGFASLSIIHVLDPQAKAYEAPEGVQTLRASWPGQAESVVIATLA